MEEYDELTKAISDLQRFMKITNDRLLRLEQKVANLVSSSPNSQRLHGAPDGGSPLGKSLGEIHNTTTTNYPLQVPRSE